jgi:signal transduction histidine kinase/ActR/RegA family two-component response regulator
MEQRPEQDAPVKVDNKKVAPTVWKVPGSRWKPKGRFLFILLLVMVLLISIYPVLAQSSARGSSDLHAAVEIVGALLALLTGLTLFMHYYSLGDTLYLLMGLAFMASGAGDLTQGLLLFPGIKQVVGMTASTPAQFLPGAEAVTALMWGFLLAAAPLIKVRDRQKDARRKTFAPWITLGTLVISAAVTVIIFKIPLPRFIYPEQWISRPVDFLSAFIATAALVLFIRNYWRLPHMLNWWYALSIGIGAVGQIMMSFSRELFDPFFHIAGLYRVMGCTAMLAGFSLYLAPFISQRLKVEEKLNGRQDTAGESLGERIIEDPQQLIEANRELQKEVAELRRMEEKIQLEMRQRKQAEEQLRVLMDDVERTNKELEEFAYVVSHDLKAPLRGINSLARWIHEDYAKILDDQGRQYLEKLLVRTRRMHNLIEGVLRYSRIGRVKITQEVLDSDTVAREISEDLAPPENISITINGKLPDIVYDKMLLTQVFQNLIGNAVKHLGKPEGNIIVSCQDQGNVWRFCVKDDGIGIEARHYDKIFKIFQSLKPQSETEIAGIGLSLVKKIVERSGGNVWVESITGEGSSFYFTVPKTPETDYTTSSLTVLIIDDNREFIDVATAMLEREKHKVLSALTGTEAYEIIKVYKDDIHIVLMDIHIPGEDAVERFENIKKLNPQVKIIACTGVHLPEIMSQLKEKGLAGVLSKPFKMNDINRIIGHVSEQ